jgi:pimeloyl-ACP methyl ester carboxylesterase
MAYVEILGHRLEYEDIARARPAAPDLVLLHGGLGSLAMWRDFPAKLAAATGCRTVAYSRWGNGKSERKKGPWDTLYMHRAALEELPALRAALDLNNPVLAGHGDGASIALIHAGAGSWPVRGLILEAPHVFVEETSIKAIERAKTAYEEGHLKRRLARFHDDPGGVFWGWNDIWLSPVFRGWNIEEYLPPVTCPALAIQGVDDQYGTLDQVNAIGRQLRGTFEKLVLEDCTYAPHHDQEADTLAAMVGFIATV